jgi:hypothetical protein
VPARNAADGLVSRLVGIRASPHFEVFLFAVMSITSPITPPDRLLWLDRECLSIGQSTNST